MDKEIELIVYDKNEEYKLLTLNTELKQLKDLFEMINTLVVEQQYTLDIIEENVSCSGSKIDLVEVDLTSVEEVKHKTNIYSIWFGLGTFGLVSLGASIPLSIFIGTKVTISSVVVIGLLYSYLKK
jgi:hypothetical protein